MNVFQGAYSDLSSYHLICQSSVDDLNTRLKDKVKPGRFRPNFVVEGGLPYEEDNWKWVKIGDVIFKNAKPCARYDIVFLLSFLMFLNV